jgi:hypothetical protein
MATGVYNAFKKRLLDGNLNLGSDTIKVLLVTSGYTPDFDAHDFVNDVVRASNEITGTGYTSGGYAFTSKVTSQDNTDNEGVFDAENALWTSATITARQAVLYKDAGGADSTWPLIACIDLGSDKVSTGGNFEIVWDGEGIINIT